MHDGDIGEIIAASDLELQEDWDFVGEVSHRFFVRSDMTNSSIGFTVDIFPAFWEVTMQTSFTADVFSRFSFKILGGRGKKYRF